MSIVTALTGHLGRALTGPEATQASIWADWVRADITAAASAAGSSIDSLDPAQIERFTVAAITRRWAIPQGVQRVDISVDDGRVGRTYVNGELDYLPAWWGWLGLPDPAADTETGWSGSIGYQR